MRRFTLYGLTGDGHVSQVRELEASSPLEARREAEALMSDHETVEVREFASVIEIVARGAAVRRYQILLAGVKFEPRSGVEDRGDRKRERAQQDHGWPLDTNLRKRAENSVFQAQVILPARVGQEG